MNDINLQKNKGKIAPILLFLLLFPQFYVSLHFYFIDHQKEIYSSDIVFRNYHISCNIDDFHFGKAVEIDYNLVEKPQRFVHLLKIAVKLIFFDNKPNYKFNLRAPPLKIHGVNS